MEVLTSAELAQRLRGQSPLEPYVSAKVVAEHLDIECRQVLAMTRAGKLPAHPIDPAATRKQWRYKLSEVDAALSQPHSGPYNEAWQPRDRKGK
jgi:hypothetical protein